MHGIDAALMILSHSTINSMKQFVLFVTTKQSTFSRPPGGAGNFFFARFAREHQPPISIFVIPTLCNMLRLSAFNYLLTYLLIL